MSVTTTRGKSDAIAASRCKGFRLALVVVAIVLISTVGCKRNPESPNFLRFIDAEPGPGYSKKIDGLLRRVLDPGANEQTFALGNGLPRSTLDFSMGVDDQGAGAAYDFEIFLDSGGTSQQLYRTRVEGVGWSQGRLDIDLSAAKDARVRFRKTLLSGPAPASTAAGWGNPVLLSHGAQVPPSIVLVSIDTLRGDYLRIPGAANPRTPTFDSFARAGVLYERAMSPSSWTLPSHASLFWGVYPSAFRTEEPNHWKMPDARPLAESLRNVGYLTAAFTGGGFVSAGFGFARGFDEYYMYQDGSTTGACPPERFDGPTVFRRAGEWIRQHSGAPFFLFVHTYDVHDMCPFRVGLSPFAQVPDPGPEGRRRHGEHYRNLVTSTDALFASLLGEIDAQGLTDNTLVILTSDHGEGFWEHGFRGHGVGVRLHEELIHVPLMLRFPARLKAGGIVPQPVSLVDVAPTILALLGLPTEKTMQGLPLPGVGLNYPVQDQLSAAVFRRLQRDPGPVSELLGSWLLRPVFVQTVDSLAVRTARYKMLTFPADPAIEVFDLAQDPAERTNVAAAIPSVERNLRKQATAYWQRRVASGTDGHAPVEIDERTREQLRALGYTQ